MDINYAKQFEPINGKWYITKELGNGAFGTVFEIERRDFTNEKSALKIIPVPATQGEVNSYIDENDDADENSVSGYFYGYVEEFVNEFKLMSKFKGNSNIVSIEDYDVIERKDRFGWDILIRMELLTPLSRYYRENIPTQNDIIRLGIDICKALELCQKYNIIHRDVKPSNIFVSENGEYKLGDFGVAKVLGKTSSMSKKGTYTYMAPEVYKGDNYNANVDLYSLGSVMYKLLNNKLEMFRTEKTHADEFKALETRIMGQKEIPAPANADAALSAVILKACSYNPSDRYQSPREMREALEVFLEGKPSKKSVPIVMPVVDALDVDAGTVGVFTKKKPINKPAYSNEDTDMVNDESIATEMPKKSKKTIFAAVASVLVIVIAAVLGFAFNGNKDDIDVGLSSTTGHTEIIDEKESEVEEPSTEESTSESTTEESTEPSTEKTTTKKSTPKDEPTTKEPTSQKESSEPIKPVAPVQKEWSSWSDKLPNYVNQDNYYIEERTYSKKLEYKTSTTENTIAGWEKYDMVEGDGGYGAWSSWTAEKPDNKNGREIDDETRYRYATKKTTTSSVQNLSGWELYDTTYSWSGYGAWSEWSTNSVAESDSKKVETKKQYSYQTKEYATSNSSTLNGYDLYDSKTEYGAWGSWSSWSTTKQTESDIKDVETRTVYVYQHYCNGKDLAPSKGYSNAKYGPHTIYSTTKWKANRISAETGYEIVDGKTKCEKGVGSYYYMKKTATQYRYKTRTKTTTYYFYKWSDWSTYSDSYVADSADCNVKTLDVYRYSERTKIPTYHYFQWVESPEWTAENKSGNNIKLVERKTFYKYRDKIYTTTYYFRRWTDWKKVPNGTIADSEDMKIKVEYRFKSKWN